MQFRVSLLLLFLMIFCHIVDDYYLQGILASMKQKDWWRKQGFLYDKYSKYRNDYKMALWEHAFSWSVVMSLPLLALAFYTHGMKPILLIVVGYLVNTPIHAWIDDLKANKGKINLVQDQCYHLIQIVALWTAAVFIF